MQPIRIVAWCCALWAIVPVAAAAQPPDDEPAIQAALDAAHQAGGGTVTLPAGVHHIRRTLVLRSNVRLKGAGMGSTIIRATASPLGNKIVDGAPAYGGIAMVGADQAGVSDLTLDLFTHRVWTNGIALLLRELNGPGRPPPGASWSASTSRAAATTTRT